MYDPKSRVGTIGASDLPTILGLNPYADASPWSILHRGSRPDTPAQALGRSLEHWLVGQVKDSYRNDGIYQRDGWAHATPDGFSVNCADARGGGDICDGCARYMAVVEAKNVSWAKASDWREGVPPYVYAQVQWQMWVTGAPVAVVSALVAGEYQRHEVPRDEAFLAEAVPIARAFWADMHMGVDPPVDASHACGAALRARLEGRESEPATPATAEQETLWIDLQLERRYVKEHTANAAVASAALLQSMSGPILLSDGRELRSTAQGLRARKVRT
jgi:predicted phage-related endonuclease